MKRYVLLLGGTGARMVDALIAAASAGVFPAETLQVLLADTDRRGVRSASLAAAKLADYTRIQEAMQASSGPFAAQLTFRAWPPALPGDASSLQEFTADSEADALLCQALFDQDAAALDLREGFHGRRMLGQVTFAGLLHESDQDPDDVLACMVDDMVDAINAGEEVRVVLAGSICGGTGAAGMTALSRYIRQRTGDQARLAAVLLGASNDQEDASRAHEALDVYAREGLCETVCVLALPRSCRTNAPVDYAQFTDWLAVYAMDVLLHRPEWLTGVFTVRAPEGCGWDVFGKAAERYRAAYGSLMKTAAAWQYMLSKPVEKRLAHPFFLRDGLFGWYAHFFRRMRADREDELALCQSLGRLTGVCLLWLGGVSRTLPLDLRSATVLSRARIAAAKHYDDLTELAGQLAVMDDDAQRSELYSDNQVYRRNNPEAAEADNALRRIGAVKAEIARRRTEQSGLNSHMGGAAMMDMLHAALEAAEADSARLRERYDEAVRRIDHAETIASQEDQYRITDARTKLQRMERHRLMLDERAAYIRRDVEAAEASGLRFAKPSLPAAAAENNLFRPDGAEGFLLRDKLTRQEVEKGWATLVQPGETISFRQAMKAIRREPADRDAPLMALLEALLNVSMQTGKEGQA